MSAVSNFFGEFAQAIFVVDYQPSQIAAVKAMDHELLLENIVSTVELQRDWAREETVADVIEIVLTERLLKQ